MTGRAIHVAVIGLGVGEQHARAFAAHPDCTLACVYDLDPERRDHLARELGTRAAQGEGDVFDDRRIDAVSIASYDGDHARQTLAALRAGKHVFVEKPMCRTDAEIRAIKAAWCGAGSEPHVASNLVLRGAPLYQWLRRAIRDGELGDVYAFDGDYLYGRLSKITSGWRAEEDGYSVMLGGGVHLVDLMMWLTGQSPRRVTAAGNRISTRRTSFRYLDYAAATYEFPSGLVGRITANFGSVHRHQHVVRVFGTRGTFIYDDCGARLHSSRDARAEPIALDSLPSSKGALVPEFIASIVEGRPSQPEIDRELGVIAACVAADRALTCGDTRDVVDH